jgi:propionate CoA-transferase
VVRSQQAIAQVDKAVTDILAPLNRKVYTIVNYDNFAILPELVDEYTEMVSRLVARFYSNVTCYTTSAFLRMKIGDALKHRGVAPHIYESHQEARAVLKPPPKALADRSE